jgi:hypothetical protein
MQKAICKKIYYFIQIHLCLSLAFVYTVKYHQKKIDHWHTNLIKRQNMSIHYNTKIHVQHSAPYSLNKQHTKYISTKLK